MKTLMALTTLLVLTACGKLPAASITQPVAATANAQAPAEGSEIFAANAAAAVVNDVRLTACGTALWEHAGQVLNVDTNAVVPTGNYTTGGYFLQNGFFVPPCTYMVLNGRVCLQHQPCNSNW